MKRLSFQQHQHLTNWRAVLAGKPLRINSIAEIAT
jgi:hypothetical protein